MLSNNPTGTEDSLTFSGVTMSNLRYAVIYNDTPTDQPLIGLIDFQGEYDIPGDDFKIQWSHYSGLFRMQAW
jgi:hypothetical protein